MLQSKIKWLLGGFFMVLTLQIWAQDLHYSQFHNSPLNHNPANTGIFNGDQRFSANFRRQWYVVPVDYLTFTASYDTKFRADAAKSFWAAGAIFNYDRAGEGSLAYAHLALNASYTVGFSRSVLLTFGAMAGGGQRNLRTQDLKWGNQWNGRNYDPNLPTGEPDDLDKNKFILDVGGGLNLRLQKDSRTRLDLGAGVFHLNEPANAFYDNDDISLPMRWSFQAYGSLEILPIMDLLANGLFQQQGPHEELVFGGLLNFHISQKKAREVQLAVGVAYRLDDAVIPMIELAYDGWRAGFSYDVTTSFFEAANNGQGGPEFSLRYIVTKVRPLPLTKTCQIF